MSSDQSDQTKIADLIKSQCDQIVRDMAHHTGDQIFEVLKRNGLLMASEAAATGMVVLAAVKVLMQAVDQCSRAAEHDCTGAVLQLFFDLLPDHVSVSEALEKTMSSDLSLPEAVQRLRDALEEARSLRAQLAERDARIAKLIAAGDAMAETMQHRGGPLCPARYYGDEQCTCGTMSSRQAWTEAKGDSQC